MATATLIPLSEYLATTYRPDRDYIDGELRQRNMGEQSHSETQAILARIFGNHRKDWGIRILTEQRLQVSPTRFRIPDLCVLRSSDPKDWIVAFAPILCIEILSAEDSLREMQEKVNDYATLGVQHVWIIDPWKRDAWLASSRGFEHVEGDTLGLPGTAIAISLRELFAELDEIG